MTKPMQQNGFSAELEDQAIQHWVLLTSGNATDADHEAYVRWRQRSPAHEAAAAMTEQMWFALPHTPLAQTFVPPLAPARRRGRLPWIGLAAGLGALALTGLSEPGRAYFADYSTAVGERKQLTLEDGSQVWMNSGSALSVNFSQARREISLIKGEALFEVSKDPTRPFVVNASGGSVQAVGTRFDVDREGRHVRVGVTEGEVKVSSGGAQVALKATQKLEYADGLQPSGVAALDMSTASAWQRGKLIFNRRPLSEVFADIERYVPGSLVLAGNLPDTPVSGVFDLDDIPGILAILSHTQSLRIYQMPWLTVVVNGRG